MLKKIINELKRDSSLKWFTVWTLVTMALTSLLYSLNYHLAAWLISVGLAGGFFYLVLLSRVLITEQENLINDYRKFNKVDKR